ncbi:MAG: cupin domain-containing protein [Burkholderiales bacterium]|nr:cupin domain-containing protein [Burkholderiales bacterium]
MSSKCVAVQALDVPPRTRPSYYPEPFRSLMAGRTKRPLGDLFGLTNFGVNITVVAPGAVSSLRHAHATQDEFVFVLSGTLILHTDDGETELQAGMCAGFKAGSGNAHRLMNKSGADAVYLEVGDRTPGDAVVYPDEDLLAERVHGGWVFKHKDGRGYD